jgi:tyrosine-protein phosphatase SIW14
MSQMSQVDNGLDPMTDTMTSKRNSRAFLDEAAHRGDGQQKYTSYRSRRNSRSSNREDNAVNGLDGEETSSSNSPTRDSSSASRSHSASALNKEASSIVSAAMSQAKGLQYLHPSRTLYPHEDDHAVLSFKDLSADLLKAELTSVVAPAIAIQSDLVAPPLDGRPHNFGVVVPGVYRSSYPKPEHYKFIQDLQLKTMV